MSDPTVRLDTELRELAGALVPPPAAVDRLAERVVERVRAEPAPRRTWRSWLSRRARWVAALIAGAGIAGIVVSPVGAQVREWLDFHGVAVTDGGPSAGEPTPPPAKGTTPLDEAADRAGFIPLVPSDLGEPDRVQVSRDRSVVSMSWESGAGTVRLDQFRAPPSPLFWKTANDARYLDVDGRDALWFPTPHEVVVVRADGEHSYPPRLAAATLVWTEGDLTLRLEGDLTAHAAIAIAESSG